MSDDQTYINEHLTENAKKIMKLWISFRENKDSWDAKAEWLYFGKGLSYGTIGQKLGLCREDINEACECLSMLDIARVSEVMIDSDAPYAHNPNGDYAFPVKTVFLTGKGEGWLVRNVF